MMTLEDLIWMGLIMLIGEEGKHWYYYDETDSNWWEIRLWDRKN